MEGYQDRLLDEYSTLEDATTKLATFVQSAEFAKVSLQDQSYLEAQLPVQQKLLAILASRVAAQKTAKEEKTAKKPVAPTPLTKVEAVPAGKDDKKK